MQKILVLSRDTQFTTMLQDWLKRSGVEVVDTVSNAEAIKFGELAARYNTIIVDKSFAGQARATSTLVRRIRKEYFDPMIGIALHPGNGDVFSLQVAGCNFVHVGGGDVVVCDRILNIVSGLEEELSQDYQR